MISVWGWIANVILALLLTGTLVMAVRLDRALRVVRRDRAVFEALITNLSSATTSVKLGIQALRNEADRAAEQIERRTEDADKLATDLSFLIDAANRAGSRLEEGQQVAAPQSWRSAAGPRNSDDSRDGNLQGNPPGGLRELVGIARRRRTRTAGTGASTQHADAGSPAPEATVSSRNEQDVPSIMMEG
ncbi:MAG: DUF6468 domain-containing protein [Acetobacteraceae bacterium]|nr:DUF6468 domain-containing protein [Acetobacteraceae bacterium]